MTIGERMQKWWRVTAVAATVAVVGLSGCGASADVGPRADLDLVGFSILEQPNRSVFKDFGTTPDGRGVGFRTSYGASGDQSRSVASGQKADLVHFSLETDVARLVDAGLVAEDWNTGPTRGIASQSVVVLVVRKGNPKNIRTWNDLVRSDVEVVTPNPGSSGSARWNILAAWGSVIADGGTEDSATAYLTKLFDHTVALPGSAREATTAFQSGTGDVLLSYENEAILARQKGADFDYVVPDETLLIENPAAVTKDAKPAAATFLQFLESKPGQLDYARNGFRPLVDVGSFETPGANDPSNPYPAPAKLLTIEKDFGGWAAAARRFFDENDGIVTRIQAATGKQ
ncbi:MAG TPA: sulfate ABC transporter substrate-binding protein [Marmoricola sp.]|nr:sulfate ABC transporter substrate-binding protein [Marmoricola sp.]